MAASELSTKAAQALHDRISTELKFKVDTLPYVVNDMNPDLLSAFTDIESAVNDRLEGYRSNLSQLADKVDKITVRCQQMRDQDENQPENEENEQKIDNSEEYYQLEIELKKYVTDYAKEAAGFYTEVGLMYKNLSKELLPENGNKKEENKEEIEEINVSNDIATEAKEVPKEAPKGPTIVKPGQNGPPPKGRAPPKAPATAKPKTEPPKPEPKKPAAKPAGPEKKVPEKPVSKQEPQKPVATAKPASPEKKVPDKPVSNKAVKEPEKPSQTKSATPASKPNPKPPTAADKKRVTPGVKK